VKDRALGTLQCLKSLSYLRAKALEEALRKMKWRRALPEWNFKTISILTPKPQLSLALKALTKLKTTGMERAPAL
jgi:hypothetical protein